MLDLGKITEPDIIEFYKQYYSAFTTMTPFMKPIAEAWTDLGVRVSFDKDLEPFVGESLGFNTLDMRRYLNESKLVVLAKTAIQKHLSEITKSMPGGRFFFGTDGIFKKNENMNPIQIAKWEFNISPKAKSDIDLFIFQKATIEKLKRENELLKSLYKNNK